jgi:hypothetical protein
VVDERPGVLAADFELAHVRDVEHAGGGPHGRMFREDTGIRDRHEKARELDELRAGPLVVLEEGRGERGHGSPGSGRTGRRDA